MKVSKSLREVWEWKEAVYEETKDMNKKETIKYFHKSVDSFLDKMGYKKIETSNGVYRLINEQDKKRSASSINKLDAIPLHAFRSERLLNIWEA